MTDMSIAGRTAVWSRETDTNHNTVVESNQKTQQKKTNKKQN